MIIIDIVTITYNNYKGLVKTTESIMKQKYKSINWIIIDGASEDNTVEYINQITRSAESSININIISEKDNGIYDAMNKGIEYSKGDYIIFLNAGDEFNSNDVLSSIFDNLSLSPTLIYGNYNRETNNGLLSLVKAKPILYIYHSLPTSHQAIFYKRSLIDKQRYNLTYTVSSDYHFTSKFIKKTNCIKDKNYLIVDKTISIFEYNGLSRNNLPLLYKDAFNIQKEIFNLNIIFRLLSYFLKYLRNKVL